MSETPARCSLRSCDRSEAHVAFAGATVPLGGALCRANRTAASRPVLPNLLVHLSDDADTTKERWFEAEVCRTAGEITLKSPEPDEAKAQAYFKSSACSRAQQAKSWELRAAMSLARLWRDHGKVQQARELLAPVYGWFTEGFDTRDLKEARALLQELAA